MNLSLRVLLFALSAAAQETYTGWVSDAGYARSRAASGIYTATNPDCARRCVKEGKDVVLVSEELKKVFAVDNADALTPQIGNKVRVSANSVATEKIHVNKVEPLEKGSAQCSRPPMKK